jgi:hypothetical protein
MQMRDTRTVVEPVHFGYRPLPESPDQAPTLFREMAELQRAHGATFWRFTVISPEHPQPPYPYGLYVEGFVPPEGPWRQAPFGFPLTATSA